MPVAFIGCAEGSSSAADWLPSSSKGLFRRLRRANRVAAPNRFRAVLWHQGESDVAADTSADAYTQHLTRIIREMRKEAGWQVPWLVARASHLADVSDESRAAVRAGQSKVIAQVPGVFAGPDTDQIGPEHRTNGQAHFRESGLQKHAEAWVEAIDQAFDEL